MIRKISRRNLLLAAPAIVLPCEALGQIFTAPQLSPPLAISNRFQSVGSVATERSGWTRGEGRCQFKTGRLAATNIQFIVAGFNHNLNAGTVMDVANTNTVTHELVLEYNSTLYRITWSGANTIAVAPGLQIYVSDVIPGLTIPGGSTGFLRFNLTGTSWPEGAISNGTPSSLNQYFISNAVSSQVFASGAMTLPSGGQAPGFGWLPMAMVGQTRGYQMVAAIIGNSIIDWQNDLTGDGNGNICYLRRGLWNVNGNVVPSIKLSRGNDSFGQWNGPTGTGVNSSGSRLLYTYVNTLFCEHAHNDLGGNNLASLLALARPVWAQGKTAGLKVYQCWITPQTLTDNSAPSGSAFQIGGLRDQFNAALAAEVTAGRLDGTLDPNAPTNGVGGCESQTTHGIYAGNNYCNTDGIHMDPPGGVAAGATINLQVAALNP